MRLARRLCALAADFGSEVHISQEQLGIFVGAARESVNRQLQRWRKDGILDLQRGRILLQNMTKLTASRGTNRGSVAKLPPRRSCDYSAAGCTMLFGIGAVSAGAAP